MATFKCLDKERDSFYYICTCKTANIKLFLLRCLMLFALLSVTLLQVTRRLLTFQVKLAPSTFNVRSPISRFSQVFGRQCLP